MRWSHLAAQENTAPDPAAVEPAAPVPAALDPAAPGPAAPVAPPLPLALPGASVRTFDTPSFSGLTFYEIRAKSIINRVPGASRVPFEWTINPYRGCSHACTYCLGGDTPILLADGSTRPLAQLRAGDAVLGTTGAGAHRRYVATTVLAHWSTTRPAYRVTLADGTRLVSGGEHRFLTDRGWRHVSPAGPGCPALAVGDRMAGVGRFADPPKESPDYRAGFLCGLVRGDAAASARRPGAAVSAQPGAAISTRPGAAMPTRPGAAMPTQPGAAISTQPCATGSRPSAAEFARPSLAATGGFGAPRSPGAGDGAPGARPGCHAAAAWARADGYLEGVALHDALRWPEHPTGDWRRGFLAGAFGSIGRAHRLAVTFASHDEAFLRRVTDALTHQALPSRHAPGTRGGPSTVELSRDLWSALRFRHATGADATPLDAAGVGVRTDARLTVVDIEELGLTLPLYDLTTGTGDFIADGVVSHNCFARNTHTYLDLDAGRDFDTRIVVKVNAGELVRRELAAPTWRGAPIAMGTNVDVYQRAEGRYRLMPPILTALRDFANPFSILTKGTLILRDLELLKQAAEVAPVGLSFSIGFVDERLWRAVEPGTPSPRRRLDAVRTLTDAGFDVGVLMAPILPGLTDTDESIDETVAAIAAAGAVSVTPLALHLRPGAREWYAAWLTREHPALAPRYRELYRAGSYLPRATQAEITARVRLAAARHGLDRRDRAETRRAYSHDEAQPPGSNSPETAPPGMEPPGMAPPGVARTGQQPRGGPQGGAATGSPPGGGPPGPAASGYPPRAGRRVQRASQAEVEQLTLL
ncbi:intein/intein [Krasilnikovia cinnamomea]|uniref:Intein/intein n=1 Tax=Krasilnikovia cinnamomea TaxID=349313 RepID=A0A4Q7ZHS7_9ACTN|nr:intein-containing Rv2578c family radical SAM protein [Krasilnikovia cinnamomea]RZU50367.1 intein/intein [Krasilnikovia cinnamomea]